ncbi:MAG: hypothetical protein ACAF48_00815 [Candidatus Carsonella ruddii]
MKYNEYLLNLNFYLFKKKIFLNKIIYEKFKKIKILEEINIINYYNNFKKSLNYFNPFYGIKINTFFEKIKICFKKKLLFKFEKEVFLYRNFKEYKIPYKELSYIFNMSIEKIRIKKKKNV